MPVETKNIKRILRTAGVAAGFVMAVLAGIMALLMLLPIVANIFVH